jgi:hypothetical protein
MRTGLGELHEIKEDGRKAIDAPASRPTYKNTSYLNTGDRIE